MMIKTTRTMAKIAAIIPPAMALPLELPPPPPMGVNRYFNKQMNITVSIPSFGVEHQCRKQRLETLNVRKQGVCMCACVGGGGGGGAGALRKQGAGLT